MESRGLIVSNREKALELLAETNYYRLSGYWLTLESGDSFKAGVSFENIWDIYTLDSELRLWLWSAIMPIEVKLRTSFAYHIAHATHPLGHLDSSNFDDHGAYKKAVVGLEREIKRALRDKVPCVTHNIEKYGVLPIWAAVEVMSMGVASRFYGNLSKRASYANEMGVKEAIARDFGTKPRYLSSWLKHLTNVRNICGHHNRFYNRLMKVRPKLLKMDLGLADTHKQFSTFIVLKRLYERSWPERWPGMLNELSKIIDAHPMVDLKPMGFPENWRELLSL